MTRCQPSVSVLAHGSGSGPDFLRRAFGAPFTAAGWEVFVVEDRTGCVARVQDAVDRAVRATGARLVGGVSLGAHAVARWAATEAGRRASVEGLVLLLPAWTGEPGAVAALSALAADDVERDGLEQVLHRVDDGSWVGRELAAAWPSYGWGLPRALRATSRSVAPTVDDLRRIEVPVGVVAFEDDPFHPVEVAREWCAALPRAALVELDHEAPAADRAVLGRAALAALSRAQGSNR